MSAILLAVTIIGAAAAVVLFVVAVWTKKAWLKTFVLGAAAVWLTFYAVTLLATSFLSEEKTLAPPAIEACKSFTIVGK